jgi:DNA primase
MADSIEQIKSRLDVVDVISGYLKVQRSGLNFKARCPFHNEKTPSFYISPERQIWHCFGCSKGGDMFGFIKEIEGVEFPEALRILAAKAGVQLEQYGRQEKNDKTRLFEISELATKFFEKQLWESPTGQKALVYLHDRGLTDETIKEFRLGFAPNDWHALGAYLQQCKYATSEIIETGLAIANERGAYDRFRSRITFPIFDTNGSVVGFSARIFSTEPIAPAEEGAKYINTPQTLIYDKSRVLYGLSKGKLDIKQVDKCLLVEGNMDAIMSWQGGVKNVVATSGTALTQQQLKLLQRYTTNLDFCFDTDQAGALATRRGIGLALSHNFNINVVEIGDEECKDPADYVKKYGSKWTERVASSKPVIQFYFDKARQGFDGSVSSKKSIVAAVAPLIKRLVSRVERSHWVAQMAGFLRVTENVVEADLAVAKDDLAVYGEDDVKKAAPAPAAAPSAALTIDMLSEALMSVIMKNPALFAEDVKTIDTKFLDPQVASVIAKLTASGTAFDVGEFMKQLREEHESYRFEFAYIKSQELWKDFKDEELKAEFYNLLHKIKQKAVVNQLSSLEFDIKAAETAHDVARVQELMSQFASLARELAEIHKV